MESTHWGIAGEVGVVDVRRTKPLPVTIYFHQPLTCSKRTSLITTRPAHSCKVTHDVKLCRIMRDCDLIKTSFKVSARMTRRYDRLSRGLTSGNLGEGGYDGPKILHIDQR